VTAAEPTRLTTRTELSGARRSGRCWSSARVQSTAFLLAALPQRRPRRAHGLGQESDRSPLWPRQHGYFRLYARRCRCVTAKYASAFVAARAVCAVSRGVQRLTHISCEGRRTCSPMCSMARRVLLVYLLLRRMGCRSARRLGGRSLSACLVWFPCTKIEYGKPGGDGTTGVWYLDWNAAAEWNPCRAHWQSVPMLCCGFVHHIGIAGAKGEPTKASAQGNFPALAWMAAGMAPAIALVALATYGEPETVTLRI